jgi:hypothetical protein
VEIPTPCGTAALVVASSNPGYGIQHLCDDLDRFVFLLGGGGGEQFFTGDHDQPDSLGDPTTTDQPAQ